MNRVETQGKSPSAIFVLHHESSSPAPSAESGPHPAVVFATYQLHKMHPDTPIFVLGKTSKDLKSAVSPVPTIERLIHMGIPKENVKQTFNWQKAPSNQVRESLRLHKHNMPELFEDPLLLTFQGNKRSVQRTAHELAPASFRVTTVEQVVFDAAVAAFEDSPLRQKALQNLTKEIKTIGNSRNPRQENARRIIQRSRKVVTKGTSRAWKRSLTTFETALRLPNADRKRRIKKLHKLRSARRLNRSESIATPSEIMGDFK